MDREVFHSGIGSSVVALKEFGHTFIFLSPANSSGYMSSYTVKGQNTTQVHKGTNWTWIFSMSDSGFQEPGTFWPPLHDESERHHLTVPVT